MKNLTGIVLAALLLSGCSPKTQELSPNLLTALILDAASGSNSANDSLSGLFNFEPNPASPLNVYIDTFSLNGRKIFAAAVEFHNSSSNRFVIYDQYLNCFLIDKSLNGRLKLETIRNHGFNYFTLEENYSSNDSILLKRLSIYRGDTTVFKLAFRTFTEMKTTDTLFVHNLYEITPEVIRTNISAPVFSGLNNFNDDYYFDNSMNVYKVKKAIYFDEFVIDFINSMPDTIHHFITPAVNKTRSDVSSVFEYTDSNTPEYYLSLNEDWKELRNKTAGFLKGEIIGSKYVNEKLKSDIYVFRIPFHEEAESYIDVQLDNEVNGNYNVRYSADLRSGDNIRKFFEYSCRTKKFLLILTAFSDTYAANKQDYFEIINTFYINC